MSPLIIVFLKIILAEKLVVYTSWDHGAGPGADLKVKQMFLKTSHLLQTLILSIIMQHSEAAECK